MIENPIIEVGSVIFLLPNSGNFDSYKEGDIIDIRMDGDAKTPVKTNKMTILYLIYENIYTIDKNKMVVDFPGYGIWEATSWNRNKDSAITTHFRGISPDIWVVRSLVET